VQQRLLAHELGHFLSDIFFIRQLWLKTIPEQKKAIEQAFSWQDYDDILELYGLIKGLPRRPRTIVGRGNDLLPETSERELQADLIAREIIAPWNRVLPSASLDKSDFVERIREQFGLPRKIAAYYYDDLKRSIAPKPDLITRIFSPFLT